MVKNTFLNHPGFGLQNDPHWCTLWPHLVATWLKNVDLLEESNEEKKSLHAGA